MSTFEYLSYIDDFFNALKEKYKDQFEKTIRQNVSTHKTYRLTDHPLFRRTVDHKPAMQRLETQIIVEKKSGINLNVIVVDEKEICPAEFILATDLEQIWINNVILEKLGGDNFSKQTISLNEQDNSNNLNTSTEYIRRFDDVIIDQSLTFSNYSQLQPKSEDNSSFKKDSSNQLHDQLPILVPNSSQNDAEFEIIDGHQVEIIPRESISRELNEDNEILIPTLTNYDNYDQPPIDDILLWIEAMKNSDSIIKEQYLSSSYSPIIEEVVKSTDHTYDNLVKTEILEGILNKSLTEADEKMAFFEEVIATFFTEETDSLMLEAITEKPSEESILGKESSSTLADVDLTSTNQFALPMNLLKSYLSVIDNDLVLRNYINGGMVYEMPTSDSSNGMKIEEIEDELAKPQSNSEEKETSDGSVEDSKETFTSVSENIDVDYLDAVVESKSSILNLQKIMEEDQSSEMDASITEPNCYNYHHNILQSRNSGTDLMNTEYCQHCQNVQTRDLFTSQFEDEAESLEKIISGSLEADSLHFINEALDKAFLLSD